MNNCMYFLTIYIHSQNFVTIIILLTGTIYIRSQNFVTIITLLTGTHVNLLVLN